ncbi:MAG: DNA-binding NarL/FixJ family response regulator [Phycisphaerales bacterium]|jgi:DNA-binding NarL/FixJ family response regulator
MDRIRVLIAEDHEGMLAQIENLLRPVFEIVASVGDGPSLLAAAARVQADVTVLDIAMPGMNGFKVARALRESSQKAGIVFLSIHDDPDYRKEAFEAGALAYVIKPRMGEDLINAIKSAASGRRFFPRSGESDTIGSHE